MSNVPSATHQTRGAGSKCLYNDVAKLSGLRHEDAVTVVRCLTETIRDYLVSGVPVTIDQFGTFTLGYRKGRKAKPGLSDAAGNQEDSYHIKFSQSKIIKESLRSLRKAYRGTGVHPPAVKLKKTPCRLGNGISRSSQSSSEESP